MFDVLVVGTREREMPLVVLWSAAIRPFTGTRPFGGYEESPN
jgi:hypothetical protein